MLGVERLTRGVEQCRSLGEQSAGRDRVALGAGQMGAGLAHCQAVPCQSAAEATGLRQPLAAWSSRPPSAHAIAAGTAIITWHTMHVLRSSEASTA